MGRRWSRYWLQLLSGLLPLLAMISQASGQSLPTISHFVPQPLFRFADPPPAESGFLGARLIPIQDSDAEDSWPNISQPGPDMGDFPNSASTLPKGRMYLESAPVTFQTKSRNSPQAYAWPFLFRYGVTNDVEFRVLGFGLVNLLDNGTTGFAPPAIDMKVHLWDDQMDRWQPAASLEVAVQTTWGSRMFNGGTQPSLNLNLDFPLNEKLNIEMTLGYAGVQDAVTVVNLHRRGSVFQRANLSDNQFTYQWAIERQVTEKFQIFVHGYYNGPILLQSGPGSVAGMGWFYQLSDRTMIFNSYNAGLDKAATPFATQLGFAVAL